MKRTAVGAGVLVAVVAVAAVAIGGVGATTQADDTAETGGSFGAEISSFMQASSAEAEAEVDDGMFNAALNRTDDSEERQPLIERRQERLQQRQQRLEDRRSRISTEDGPGVRDRALAARVTVGAASLERSVNGTEQAAQAAGLDTGSLDEVRSNARTLRGPEVAELARNVTDTPSSGDRGPQVGGDRDPQSGDDRGLPIDLPGASDPGSGSPVPNRSNVRGPSGDAGPSDGSANGSDRGSSGQDRGSSGQDRGQSGDAGPPGEEDDRGNDGRSNARDGTGAGSDG